MRELHGGDKAPAALIAGRAARIADEAVEQFRKRFYPKSEPKPEEPPAPEGE